MDQESLTKAAAICEMNKAWLVMDDTYEDFVYEGRTHHCINSPNVIHIFSFSKVRFHSHTFGRLRFCRRME